MFSGLFSEKVDSKLYQPPHFLHGASKRWRVIWRSAAKPLKTPIEFNWCLLLLRKVQATCWILLLHFVRYLYHQSHCDVCTDGRHQNRPKHLVGPLLAGCSMAHKPVPLQFSRWNMSQSPLPPPSPHFQPSSATVRLMFSLFTPLISCSPATLNLDPIMSDALLG